MLQGATRELCLREHRLMPRLCSNGMHGPDFVPGDSVKIYSNTFQRMCTGKVVEIRNSALLVEFCVQAEEGPLRLRKVMNVHQMQDNLVFEQDPASWMGKVGTALIEIGHALEDKNPEDPELNEHPEDPELNELCAELQEKDALVQQLEERNVKLSKEIEDLRRELQSARDDPHRARESANSEEKEKKRRSLEKELRDVESRLRQEVRTRDVIKQQYELLKMRPQEEKPDEKQKAEHQSKQSPQIKLNKVVQQLLEAEKAKDALKEKLENNLKKVQSENANLQERIKSLNGQIKSQVSTEQKLKGKIKLEKDLKGTIESLASEKEATERKLQSLEKDLKGTIELGEDLQGQIKSLASEKQSLEKDLDNLRKAVHEYGSIDATEILNPFRRDDAINKRLKMLKAADLHQLLKEVCQRLERPVPL